VPSTFSEAFGMVLAEAACCGAVPLSAAHSGLAEVSAILAPAVPDSLRPLLSFGLGPDIVRELGSDLARCLALATDSRETWQRARASLADVAQEEFGWHRVAREVIVAAQGRLPDLFLGAAGLAVPTPVMHARLICDLSVGVASGGML